MSEEKPQVIDEPKEEKKQQELHQKIQENGKTTKKQISYTYWVDEKNKSRQLPQEHRPKKIQSPAPLDSKPANNGPSHWNTSGTWEQRSISMKELSQSSKESIKKWLQQKECDMILEQFKRIFSNNKRKLLYDISGKIKFEGDDLHIKLQEITCTGDMQYSVKGKKKQERDKLSSSASKIVSTMVEHFSRFKQ